MIGFELFKETTYLHACRLMEDGRYGEALPLLHKLVGDGETGEDVLVTALSCALHMENWDLAGYYAQAIEERGYSGPDALFWLADYYLGTGAEAAGRQALAALEQDYPDDTGLLWDIADMLSDYGYDEEYWSTLRKITATKTKDPFELLDQADAFLVFDEKQNAAIRAYEAVRRLPKDNMDDLLYAGSVLEQCGEIQKALESYQAGLERFAEAADFVLGIVRCQVALGDFAAAEKMLETAQNVNPELPGLEAAAKAVAKAKRKIVDFQSYRKRKLPD